MSSFHLRVVLTRVSLTFICTFLSLFLVHFPPSFLSCCVFFPPFFPLVSLFHVSSSACFSFPSSFLLSFTSSLSLSFSMLLFLLLLTCSACFASFLSLRNRLPPPRAATGGRHASPIHSRSQQERINAAQGTSKARPRSTRPICRHARLRPQHSCGGNWTWSW